MGQQQNSTTDHTTAILAAIVAVILIVTVAAVALSITEQGSTTTLVVLLSLMTPIVTGLLAMLGGKSISKVVSKTDEANEKLDSIGQALNGDMDQRFRRIVASEIGKLRNEVNTRLEAIEQHVAESKRRA